VGGGYRSQQYVKLKQDSINGVDPAREAEKVLNEYKKVV